MNTLPLFTAADVQAAAPRVREHLAAGKVLAHPTETIYGLGGRATESDLEALFALKGRGDDKPVLLLVSGRHMAEEFGVSFTAAASGLASACWPGPLTLVLPASGDVPKRLRGASGGVGVRWTSHERMADLIATLGHQIGRASCRERVCPHV